MQSYFAKIQDNGKLASLKDRFFNVSELMSFISTHTFLDLKEDRLPKYKGLIEQVAIEYDLDWRLLAAISYQDVELNVKLRRFHQIFAAFFAPRTLTYLLDG